MVMLNAYPFMKHDVEPNKQHNLNCEKVIKRMSKVMKVLPGVEVSAPTARVTEGASTSVSKPAKTSCWEIADHA